jgi:hypothetical protein
MYSHGNRVADPQLLDNAIHALRDYTEARRGSRPFPDGPDRQARQCWASPTEYGRVEYGGLPVTPESCGAAP